MHLLNEVVLEDHQTEEYYQPTKNNQVHDKSESKKFPRLAKYSYSEIICFKYFSWCQKNSQRYSQYLKHTQIYKLRLDVKKLIINQGDIGTLSMLIMQPYQAKIASRLEIQRDQDQLQKKSSTIEIEDAVLKLSYSESGEQKICHKERIDSCLREIVEGETGKTFGLKVDAKRKNVQLEKALKKDPEVTKKQSKDHNAPFDAFGVTPEFYIQGETETTSWVRCFCTAIQITITILVIIFFTRSFVRKEEADVTILNIKSDENAFISLKQNKQMFVLNHYIFRVDPEQLFPARVYYVQKNTKTRAVVRTPIDYVECNKLEESVYADLNLKLKANDLLQYQYCINFEGMQKDYSLGEDKQQHIKRTIEIEVNPCLVNCYQHDFGIIPIYNPAPPFNIIGTVPMPQEMKPDNPFGLYTPFASAYLWHYTFVFVFANPATNFENYDKPISRAIGIPQEVSPNLAMEFQVKITFEQLTTRTYDGFLKRNMKEETRMQYKTSTYKTKRRNLFSRFILIEIEVSNDVVLVERVYPNFIDLLSNIGGIIDVLVFLCIAIGIAHNQILFDKYLFDQVFLAEDNLTISAPLQDGELKEPLDENGKDVSSRNKPLSYLDIFAVKYCFKKKENAKKQAYEKMMKIISERLDIGYLAKSTEQLELLSKAMFRPYQMTILHHYKDKNDAKLKESLEIPFETAKNTLLQDKNSGTGDLYHKEINKIILKLAKRADDVSKGTATKVQSHTDLDLGEEPSRQQESRSDLLKQKNAEIHEFEVESLK